ncbi:MAG: TrmB family transcriptional regulator, partial [Candidatus Aenigmatarchaeota archaeon]
ELRHLDTPPGRFSLVDGKHVIFALTDDAKVHETQDVAFWALSDHAAKDSMKPYFDHLWTTAKKQ